MPETPPSYRSRVRGTLFGLALGDALAAKTEFLSVAKILERWPPAGPREPEGDPALVTDDTQMALAVGEALVACASSGSIHPSHATAELVKAFVAWFKSPDNCRAPGRTCLLACKGLYRGKPWLEATVAGSKGCGANMRVAPAAFAPRQLRAGLSQLQAALTHGHPTGLAASDLTSFAIAELVAGCPPRSLPARLIEYARTQATTYHEAWLGALWRRQAAPNGEGFIRIGWDECLGALARLQQALEDPRPDLDPCLATGDGWIAEEALASGLHCFLLHPDDPLQALRRAAVTRGDSDSIACLTGAFAGALHGEAAWPEAWTARVEYRDRLDALAESLVGLAA